MGFQRDTSLWRGVWGRAAPAYLAFPSLEYRLNAYQFHIGHILNLVFQQRAGQAQVCRVALLQRVLDAHHANKNMTIYCQPEWSGTPAREFDQLRGNFAMEIWNTGCALENGLDTNAYGWDEVLMTGQRIFGVAVDDCHHLPHCCKGWVRVNAEKDLNAILAALRQGAFYSSCGPEIYDFRVEAGKAVVECSPSESIAFRWGHLPTRVVRGDVPITRAEFDVPPYLTYLRAVVTDEAGRRAWTNPIFLK